MKIHVKNKIIEFSISFVIGLCIYCISILLVSINSTYKYEVELWNNGEQPLHLLYPLVFTIPFCWVLFHEKNGSYWKSMFNRTSLDHYIKKRLLTAIFMSMAAMFLVSFGSMFFSYMIGRGDYVNYEPIVTFDFYGWFQLKHPITYAFILSCWRAVLSALFTTLSMVITLISNNIFIAMTGAFIYSIAENYITAILRIPELSICTSYYPNRLVSDMITFPKLLIGPFMIIIVIIILSFYYNQKIKFKLMD